MSRIELESVKRLLGVFCSGLMAVERGTQHHAQTVGNKKMEDAHPGKHRQAAIG